MTGPAVNLFPDDEKNDAPSSPPRTTLFPELGISKKVSSVAQQLAALPAEVKNVADVAASAEAKRGGC